MSERATDETSEGRWHIGESKGGRMGEGERQEPESVEGQVPPFTQQPGEGQRAEAALLPEWLIQAAVTPS